MPDKVKTVYVLSILFLLFSVDVSFGQSKDWLNYNDRSNNYPSSIYFTGYISQYVDKNDDLDLAKSQVLEQAKVQMSENVKITIESDIVNKMQNVNSISLEEFQKVSKSYSSIQVTGLNSDTYTSKKKNEIFGFVWVKKSKVKTYYTNLIASIFEKIANKNELASSQLTYDLGAALKTFYSTNALFSEAEEAQAVLMVCGEKDPQILYSLELQQLKLEISNKTEKIKRSKNLSITELTSFLAASFRLQLDTLQRDIQFGHITYRDSKSTTEFSFRFSALFQNKMMAEGFRLMEAAKNEKTGYFLSGTYWEEGEQELVVALTLYQYDTNGNVSIIAGSQGWVSLRQLIRMGIKIKPPNYFQAVEKQKLFAKGEILNGGAKLEVWTNKGEDGLLYKQGEKLRIFIRMNRTGYVRLVNYWADGSQTLLVDNYFVDYRKVNRIIQLPMEWSVTCPCGVEFIQANAQDVEFIPLNTDNKDNITYILDSVNEIIQSNRINSNKEQSNGGFAVEKRLVMTSIE